MQTSPDSIERMAAGEGRGKLGKVGMIPVDLWRRLLPAERDDVGVHDRKGRNGASG